MEVQQRQFEAAALQLQLQQQAAVAATAAAAQAAPAAPVAPAAPAAANAPETLRGATAPIGGGGVRALPLAASGCSQAQPDTAGPHQGGQPDGQ